MSTDTAGVEVASPPGVGNTGLEQPTTGGTMATTTQQPIIDAHEQPPAGRNWKLIGQVALLIAMIIGCVVLVFLLIGENREAEPAPAPTIADQAAIREAAFKASEPIVRDVFVTLEGGLATIPPTSISSDLRSQLEKIPADDKAGGITRKGADTIVSVTPKIFEPKGTTTTQADRVGMTVCFTVGAETLKDGKNIRVAPDGTPAPPGTRLQKTYYLAPTSDGKWLVDQIEAGGPC